MAKCYAKYNTHFPYLHPCFMEEAQWVDKDSYHAALKCILEMKELSDKSLECINKGNYVTARDLTASIHDKYYEFLAEQSKGEK